jgi:colanic acid biosynthesis glycosyl transferase WcaI
MPSKLLNIMAVGGAVVATAYPGSDLSTTILQSGCGVLTTPLDSSALALAIESLANDKEKRNSLGKAGRVWIEQNLDVDIVLGKFYQQISEVIGTKN